MLIAVQTPEASDVEFNSSLEELRALAKTLGIEVIGQVTQKRSAFDPGAYLGSGKREELRAMVGAPPPKKDDSDTHKDNEERDDDEADDEAGPRHADTILVDHEISPSQTRNLEKETGCDVLDRTMVILEIFHRHARSRAARAQVEIVRLTYLTPRLRETGRGRDRQRGGIGGKGAGESALELDRRKIRDRVAELTGELTALEAERRTQRRRRRDSQAARVALVGYTNAGKSTWMRALTGSEVYVADKLFATLDTTVRTLEPETVPRILVSDTVGFIKNLPHDLVASFKSTLDEALEASLLVHVVDASDPLCLRQLEVTEEVLGDIGATTAEIPRLIVWNKIDRCGDEDAQAVRRAELLESHPGSVVLSARRPEDVRHLHGALVEFFSKGLEEAELRVPWSKQALRGAIFDECQVQGEDFDETGAIFQVRAPSHVLTRLREALSS